MPQNTVQSQVNYKFFFKMIIFGQFIRYLSQTDFSKCARIANFSAEISKIVSHIPEMSTAGGRKPLSDMHTKGTRYWGGEAQDPRRPDLQHSHRYTSQMGKDGAPTGNRTQI